jgi:mannose-1-phosphate guanylyltransferase/mannose-6-phosphate isomerase
MTIHPVILCGGAGARLWPASREGRAKPFVKLFGDRSLFQDTLLRVSGISGGADPVVVAGAAHAAEARRQLDELGMPGLIIVEPQGRDSGPAIAAAAAWLGDRDPAATLLVVTSDHHIPDAAAFRAAVAKAQAAADLGAIVTFGVRPTAPATAYGYIRSADAVAGAPGVLRVAQFVEKPDAARAQAYVEQGLLWNSGNFVFQAGALLAELERHAPDVLAAVRQGLAEGSSADGVLTLGGAFAGARRASFDFAVMEKTDKAAVVPVDYAWSDVGSWDAVFAVSQADGDGNVLSGDAVAAASSGCLIRAEDGVTVIALGLKDIVVVAEGGHVFVGDLARSPELKPLVEALSKAGH